LRYRACHSTYLNGNILNLKLYYYAFAGTLGMHSVTEAVQLEIERRRAYALEHGIQKIEYSRRDNPFAGKVICGTCGHMFGRKVWNSNNEKLRRII